MPEYTIDVIESAPFGQLAYVLWSPGRSDAVVIDPGFDAETMRDRVLATLDAPAPTSTTSAAASSGASTAADACTTTLTEQDPTLGSLRLDARATLDGTPARVLVFDIGGDPPSLRAIAVTDDCAVVRSTTFPAR